MMNTPEEHLSPEEVATTDPEPRRGRGRGRRSAESPKRERRGGPRGHGRRGPGSWQVSDLPAVTDVEDWFAGRLPTDWFDAVEITCDREEITVVGVLTSEPEPTATTQGRVSRFRSETRPTRVEIAAEAQERYQRTVSWGVRSGDSVTLFTTVAAPVMTRLRQADRQVLDTLVDAGVARSRSDALVWSVRLVGQHTEEWLGQLREAMAEVDKLRTQGPAL